jgi:hypothetical protein
MTKIQKQIEQALNALIKDANKQLNKAITDSMYSHAATSQAYLNGLEIAKQVVLLAGEKIST